MAFDFNAGTPVATAKAGGFDFNSGTPVPSTTLPPAPSGPQQALPQPDPKLPTPGRASLGNVGYNLGKLPGAISELATKIPGGGAFGKTLGNSIYDLGAAGSALLHGKGLAAADAELKPQPSDPSFAATVGDLTQAVATPASLVVGGPAGAGVKPFLARTVVNAGLGGAVSGGGSAARGDSAGDVALNTGAGVLGGGIGSAAVEGLGAATSALGSRGEAGFVDALTPKLPPIKYRASAKTDPGLFSGAGVAPHTPQVDQAVTAVKGAATALGKKPEDIIKTGPLSSATANQNSVRQTIADYATKIVQPFLTSNPVPTNFADYISYLNEAKPPVSIKANADAHETFNRIRERVISVVASSLKSQTKVAGDYGALTDPNIYWKARQKIDDVITEELGNKALSDPSRSGVTAAASTLRAGTADFISDMLRYPGQMEQVARYREAVNTLMQKGVELGPKEYVALAEQMGLKPTGAQVADQWDQHMSTLNGLYKADTNLGTKTSAEQGRNTLQIFAKNNPGTAKALGAAGVGAAGAIGAGTAYEIGKSALGQ